MSHQYKVANIPSAAWPSRARLEMLDSEGRSDGWSRDCLHAHVYMESTLHAGLSHSPLFEATKCGQCVLQVQKLFLHPVQCTRQVRFMGIVSPLLQSYCPSGRANRKGKEQADKWVRGWIGSWSDRRPGRTRSGDVDEQMSRRVRAGSLGKWASRNRVGKGANGQLNR